MSRLLTSVQIGDFCGISDRTIRDWQQKGVLPKTNDMSVVVQAILAYQKELNEERDDQPDLLTEAKVRLANLQGDKLALELATRRKELVESSAVDEIWSKYIYACKIRLLSMPSKLAYELSAISDPTTMKQVLERAVDEVLRELSTGED